MDNKTACLPFLFLLLYRFNLLFAKCNIKWRHAVRNNLWNEMRAETTWTGWFAGKVVRKKKQARVLSTEAWEKVQQKGEIVKAFPPQGQPGAYKRQIPVLQSSHFACWFAQHCCFLVLLSASKITESALCISNQEKDSLHLSPVLMQRRHRIHYTDISH